MQVRALVHEFHVQPEAAFHITRPCWGYLIRKRCEALGDDGAGRAGYTRAAKEVMAPLVEQCGGIHPKAVWADLTPQIYVAFWTLSLYDLQTPAKMYSKVITKLETDLSKVDRDPSFFSSKSKTKKEKNRILDLIKKLKDDESTQESTVANVAGRLESEKGGWIVAGDNTAKAKFVVQLLQVR